MNTITTLLQDNLLEPILNTKPMEPTMEKYILFIQLARK